MNNHNGALDFEASINSINFNSTLSDMERRVLGFTNTAQRETAKLDQSFNRLGQLAAGAFAFDRLTELPKALLRVRSEMQSLGIAFTTLLGSKAKADAFLQEGVDFAAKTPFQLDEVAKAQKVMLAYGFSVQTIIPTLTKLGDIAAGTGSNLQELVMAYGQIRTQGTAQWDDVNKFLERGVNLIPELSRNLKIAEGDVKQFVADGKVQFKDIEQAITDLTNGSGKLNFGGLMAEQAKSLAGLTSNLADAWDRMLNQIGKDNQDLIEQSISGAITLVEYYQPVLDTLTVLVATYGAYKAAVIATAVVQAAADVAGNVRAWFQLAATIRSARDAQIAFNLATSANPLGIMAALLVGLTAAVILYRKELSATEQAEEALTEARDKANSSVAAEQAKILSLKATIDNEKLSRQERNKALQELIALSPKTLSAITLETSKTIGATKAIDDYIASAKRKYEADLINQELQESFKRETEGNKAGPSVLDFFSLGQRATQGKGELDIIKEGGKLAEKEQKKNADRETEVRRLLGERKKALDEAGKTSVKTEADTQKVVAKSIDQLDELIKKEKERFSAAQSDRERASAKKEIDKLEAQKRRLTGELSSAEKKAAKEADKTGPFGSIAYYEAVIRKANEIISKTSKTDTAKLNEQNGIKLAAEAQVEAIRKRLAVKSFDEELADKRDKFTLYSKWVEAYGKQAADTQFSELLKSGQSYVDYLNTQIANLENERDNAGLTDKQVGNLSSLIDQRNEATGKKTAIQVFQEDLEKARMSAGTLADYLVILKQKQDDLTAGGDKSPDGIKKQQQLAEAMIKTQAELQANLQQFLVSYASSGEQQLAIQKDFAEKRAALDLRYNDKKSLDYKQALKVIDDAEKQALQDYQQRKLEETDAYKETTKVILAEGEKRQKIEIDRQRKLVEKAKEMYGVNSKAYEEALAKLNELTERGGGTATQKVLGSYASVINGFGQALSSLGGEAGQAGAALMDLANTISVVGESFTKSQSKAQLYQTAIQGVITLFSAITDAAAKRKQAENDYYASVIRQQQEYNLLLNEQISLRSKDKNLFIDNYAGQLLDNFEAQRKAQAKLDENLKKLNEGRAKGGQKNQLDNASALKLIATGAGTGAAIGSLILPGVGTAIGAVVGTAVGALTSLFGGATKKADEFGALLERYPDLIQQSADGTRSINLNLAQILLDTGQLDDKTKALVESTVEWQKQVDATREAVNAIVKSLTGQLGDSLRDSLVNAFKEGTDAAKAFSGVLSDVIENFVTKLLYTQIFSSYFDKLKEDITKSLDTQSGGDGSIIDDMQRFYEATGPAVELFNKSLQDLKDQSKAAGFDILQPTKTGSSSSSMQGTIQSQVTENTANILAGSINAIRITQADTNAIIRQQLLVLSGIEKNTGKTADNSEYLKSIDRRLEQIASDPLRGIGGGPK